MKAVEYRNYGAPEVLQVQEVAQPSPKPDQVLIKVHATTVTAADIMMREGKPEIGRLYLGLKAPKRKILGFEFAGEVVEIGAEVTPFKVGDRVFGGTTTLGCYGEYVCVSAKDVIATLPENIAYAEAAPVSGSAVTALNFLKGKAKLQAKQKVLIIGAAGGVGTYAVQYAKLMGAEVTGVCSTQNIALVRSLGADHVIDYTQQDFLKNGQQYDIIFDTVSKSGFAACKASLSAKGIYLPTVVSGKVMRQILWTSLVGGKKVKTSSTGLLPVKERLQYLLEVRELLQSSKMRTVIDRQYPLAEMADAHRYVELGHKKGAVVIAVVG